MSRPTPQEARIGDLAEALAEMTELMLSTPKVEDLLTEIARLAATAITPPASCGITLSRDHQPFTVATSDALAAELDEVQYGEGEGPCLESLHTGETVEVTDLAEETRWGDYRGHALGYGVRSSLSVPLRVNGDTKGALNLYSANVSSFNGGSRQRAEIFAAQASAVLTVVVRQAQQLELSDQLRQALAARSVIDQALGILMEQKRVDADAAFDVLRAASQHQNRKLRHIASDIVKATTGKEPEPRPFNEPT
jgi:GAF domain-containing protein